MSCFLSLLSCLCLAGFIQLQSPSSLPFARCLTHLISHFTLIVFYHIHFDWKFLLADSVSEKASPEALVSPHSPSKILLPSAAPIQLNALCLHRWISHSKHESPTTTTTGIEDPQVQKSPFYVSCPGLPWVALGEAAAAEQHLSATFSLKIQCREAGLHAHQHRGRSEPPQKAALWKSLTLHCTSVACTWSTILNRKTPYFSYTERITARQHYYYCTLLLRTTQRGKAITDLHDNEGFSLPDLLLKEYSQKWHFQSKQFWQKMYTLKRHIKQAKK